MKQIALVLGFVLAISSAAMAEPLDIDKLTDDQLKALKEDQLLTLPAIRLMERLAAIDPKTPKEGDVKKLLDGMSFLMAQGLRDAYFIDTNPLRITPDEIVEASKRFQAQIGANQTGELTMAQFKLLRQSVQHARATQVILPNLSSKSISVQIDDSDAVVEGRMEIDGDKTMNPLNHYIIQCRRQFGICTAFSAIMAQTPLNGHQCTDISAKSGRKTFTDFSAIDSAF